MSYLRPSSRDQRSEQALVASLAEMHTRGVSTRRVSTEMETLCEERISASQVFALAAQLDATHSAWRQRPLTAKIHRDLIVDAHVEHVRFEGAARVAAAQLVIGADTDGYREHLAFWLGASDSGASRRTLSDDLMKCGLTGVEYFVSDENAGLVRVILGYFGESAHQRRQVQHQRTAHNKVTPPAAQRRATDGLSQFWAGRTRRDADMRLACRIVRLIEVPTLRPHLRASGGGGTAAGGDQAIGCGAQKAYTPAHYARRAF